MTEFDVTRPYMELDHETVSGSAFLVEIPGFISTRGLKRHLFTNFHVVEANKTKEVLLYFPKFGKSPIKGRVIRVYPQCDMAIIECVGSDAESLSGIANLKISGDPVEKFSDAYALGFPLGCDDVQISQGVISGWEDEFYHMNISINSGNSGGPVLIGDEVVAISVATINGAEAIGLGIPMIFLADIIQIKPLDHTVLCIESRTQCSVRGGTIMTMHPHDVLAHMGFQKGDVVRTMCGYPVNSFGRIAAEHLPWTDLRVDWVDVNIMRRALHGGTATVTRNSGLCALKWGPCSSCIPYVRTVYPFYEQIECHTVGALVIVAFSLNLVSIAHPGTITKDLALCAIDATHCHEPRIVVAYIDTFSDAYIEDNIQLFDVITHVDGQPVKTLGDLRTIQNKRRRYKPNAGRQKRIKQRERIKQGIHTYTLNDVIQYDA